MSDRAAAAPPTPIAAPSPGERGATPARRWPIVVLALAGLSFVGPIAQVAYATRRARACVASVTAARGPELPDCRREIRWFVMPSHVPWTATAARYRAEELSLRAALAAYDDASVGLPDAAARSRAAADLASAAAVVHAGSRRVSLEELGRAVGAPDPGRAAMLAGDRRTLLAHADEWEPWPVRLRALEAALLEGDDGRAAALARRYAEFDPRDEDLRVAVGAMLCLSGEPRRGSDLLVTVQAERAKDRHESWARNWGEVRALVVACAAKTGAPPPLAPDNSEAGAGDLLAARAVLRLGIVGGLGPSDGPAVRAAANDVVAMLKEGPFPPGARVRVLAALLASGHVVDAALAAALASPHLADGEAPLLPSPRAFTALDWLSEPRGVRPSPSRQALRHAADVLRRLAASPEISAEERLALDTAATATTLEAVRAFALAGDAAGAVALLEDRRGGGMGVSPIVEPAGARSFPGPAARALLRSTAWYVAADPGRALAEVERDPGDLHDTPALQAAWWIQKAELYASTGRRDEAARAAVAADEAAVLAGEPGLVERAQWTRLALARPPVAALRVPPPPPYPGDPAWPWVGADSPTSGPPANVNAALAQALAFWDTARHASPEQRRAARYAAFSAHRGDAPRARVAYLALAGDLLHESEGDAEVWLDAFSATASRALTLRAYAWTRAEAARFRGDDEAASRWTRRYRNLVRLASAPGDAELTEALGI